MPYGPFGEATMTGQRHGRHDGYTDGVTEQPGATFRWTTPGGNGREVTSVQLRVDNGTGSWGGWQNVPASGSRTVNGDWGTTYRAQVRAQRADGEVRTASASVTTIDAPVRRPDPPPPEPKITIVRNRSAVGQPGCTHSSCRFVDIDYENLPAGTYTYRVSDEDSAFGTPMTRHLSGSGRLEGWSYFGNPGERVTVTLRGPRNLSASIIW